MLDTHLIESLAHIIGSDDLRYQIEDLERYSADALTPFRAFSAAPRLDRMADAVVIPRSVEQVVSLVKWAVENRIPLVPYGGGTGVMGAAYPVQGGIVIDLKGLNRILEVNPTNLTATVEAGVVLDNLNIALEEHGLMLGHDPYSVHIATVAGAISTNGVGYLAAHHGSMGQQVVGMEVVLPTGQVLTTPSVPKYSAGPNLNHLFIGSEGVFGIITKATLKVFRQPEKQVYATIGFPTFDAGFKAVIELFALGLRPALVDLSEWGRGVFLFMLFQGYTEAVESQHRRALQLCGSFSGTDLGPADALDYWEKRHDSGIHFRDHFLNQPRSVRWERLWSALDGRGFDTLHTALPVSQVLEYKHRCQEIMANHRVTVLESSIWGQPEFFSMLLKPGTDKDTAQETLAHAMDEALTLAQDMGGIMEYCHGVGVKLNHLLARDMGVSLDVIRSLKSTLDPANIMNPGKLGL